MNIFFVNQEIAILLMSVCINLLLQRIELQTGDCIYSCKLRLHCRCWTWCKSINIIRMPRKYKITLGCVKNITYIIHYLSSITLYYEFFIMSFRLNSVIFCIWMKVSEKVELLNSVIFHVIGNSCVYKAFLFYYKILR